MGKIRITLHETVYRENDHYTQIYNLHIIFRRLLGVITKKDVLRHIKQMDNEDPNSVLFN